MKCFILGLFVFMGLSFHAEAANRFAFCATTCTWDATNQTMWGTASGGVGVPASVPGSGDAVIFDAATCVGGTTCTTTVNTTITVQSITMGACTAATAGCILDFSANNNSVTLSVSFSGTGTGVRTLSMGSNTWSLTAATGTIWDNTTATNFTFNTNTSTILVAGAPTQTRSMVLGTSLSYNIITVDPTNNSGTFLNVFGNTPTIATFNAVAPAGIQFVTGSTYNITNAFNFVGTGFNAPIYLFNGANSATTISITSGAPTCVWCVIDRLTFAGGATFTATNSIDLGGNSGITITGPSVGGSHIIGGG